MGMNQYPSLFQINTRVWLTSLSQALGRPATLDDISDAELNRLAELGFDFVWLLSVWQTGPQSQAVSRRHPEWRKEFEQTLPDLKEEDIAGSGFAITRYQVAGNLGGNDALARLRKRLQERGLKLMLDFVPNHVGLGHPWIDEHPEYFIEGTEDDLSREPENFVRVRSGGGELILAYGRDPYFAGWPDTLQLNYANPETQRAMADELLNIAGQCDGVRCDMAMLVLPDVFESTWKRPAPSFWPNAIKQVHRKHPEFCFLAEVYWDREWELQQQGFDFTYDKRLYDRLHANEAGPVRDHFRATLDYQNKLARFLENHDEPRAAATFPVDKHLAAAALTYFSPGMRFFHQGQFEGKRTRISPHLVRGPDEALNPRLQQFYVQLLRLLQFPTFRAGVWQLCECSPAWDGNTSSDAFIAFAWEHSESERRLVTVNYSAHQSQCRVRLPASFSSGRHVRFQNLTEPAEFELQAEDLAAHGMWLDDGPWKATVFSVRPVP